LTHFNKCPHLLKTSDRTIERDKQAIREKSAISQDPELVNIMASRLVDEAQVCIQRIRKFQRDSNCSPAAKIEGEKGCFQITNDLAERLQLMFTANQAVENLTRLIKEKDCPSNVRTDAIHKTWTTIKELSQMLQSIGCPDTIFPLSFESSIRQPGYYWHNIGKSNNQWWRFLVSHGQIATSFDNQPGDQGEKILKGYIKGDTVIAYARRYGAIGFGIIKDPVSYKLIKPASNGDHLGGELLHRLNIEWKYTVKDLNNAVSPAILLKKYGIYHPRATSAKINANKAKLLTSKMQNMLNNSG